MHLVCNMFISACNIAYPFDVFLVFDNDTCAHENIQSIIDTATDILLVQACVTTLLINARVCCVIERRKRMMMKQKGRIYMYTYRIVTTTSTDA